MQFDPPNSQDLTVATGRMRRLALALVGNAHDAEDVAQEAWSRALQGGATPDDGDAWLNGVARNVAREHRRAGKRRRRRESASAKPESQSPDQLAVDHIEAIHSLVQVVRSLPQPYRSALIMQYVVGMAPAEAAEALGVNRATLRSRVHRGMEMVRAELERRSSNDRKPWQMVIAPLVADAARVTLGGLLVSKAASIAGAALLLLLLLVGVGLLWVLSADTEEGESPQATTVVAPKTASAPSGAVLRGRKKSASDVAPQPSVGAALADILLPGSPGRSEVRFSITGPDDSEVETGTREAGPIRIEYTRPKDSAAYVLRLHGPQGAFAVRSLPTQTTDLGRIVLVPRLVYTGEARLGSGQPLVGVRIDLLQDTAAAMGTSMPTDDQGRFQIPLSSVTMPLTPTAGGELPRWSLVVRPSRQGSFAPVPARYEGLADVHRARFAPAAAVAIRFVHAGNRKPLRHAAVRWTPEAVIGLNVDPRARRAGLVQRLRTNEDGVILPLWPAGVWRSSLQLTVDGADVRYAVLREDVPEDRPLELTVATTGAVLRVRCKGLGAAGSVARTATIQIYLSRGDGAPGYLRHLVTLEAGSEHRLHLGDSPLFSPREASLGEQCAWVARFPGHSGRPRFQEGSSPIREVHGGWTTEIQLDPNAPPAIRPLWVLLDDAIRGAVGGPKSLTLIIMSNDGRPHRFTAYPMGIQPVPYGKHGAAWPFLGIDDARLKSLGPRDVAWSRAMIRTQSGEAIGAEVSHAAIVKSINGEAPLSLLVSEEAAHARIRVIDHKNSPVAGAVVSVMPAYADGGGAWHELRIQSMTDRNGVCVVSLPDQTVDTVLAATHLPTGRSGFARRAPGRGEHTATIRLTEVEEFHCTIELPDDSLPGSESVYLIARPSWLAPRVPCVRGEAPHTWKCRASYNGYRLQGSVRVRRGRKVIMHTLDVDAVEANGGTASGWKPVSR